VLLTVKETYGLLTRAPRDSALLFVEGGVLAPYLVRER